RSRTGARKVRRAVRVRGVPPVRPIEAARDATDASALASTDAPPGSASCEPGPCAARLDDPAGSVTPGAPVRPAAAADPTWSGPPEGAGGEASPGDAAEVSGASSRGFATSASTETSSD